MVQTTVGGADLDLVGALKERATADAVWRVSPALRFSSQLLVVAWFALALGITLAGGTQMGAVLLLWIVLPVVALGAWRWMFVPYVALMPDSVFIQNRVTSKSIRYSDITEVSGEPDGLRFVTTDGDVVVAWAVQKSNAARRLQRETLADEVSAAIMARRLPTG